ncbi:hypothetical protein KPH14_009857 [Odynerus spinipes]|uniref:Uncharacterized protein n=1 Tax=Odynerus spinipes TaxID=1348599 RepID=A0AAD9RVZ5_9HYME|nr:hypothetical protein KPH14_009857 [Odynerus spinipes]
MSSATTPAGTRRTDFGATKLGKNLILKKGLFPSYPTTNDSDLVGRMPYQLARVPAGVCEELPSKQRQAMVKNLEKSQEKPEQY